ncbi:uncharacterized protein LOC126738715 [Anthonomus grandis grandis]|uniref:uncharacterized protein LOC126738715 n=1 Tax=Anthonomus grandis grandis TaxID=2921223 RepID=UPI0021667499|nr:uncharacterized protein LOC126738715 [Anthonomus grandis grandis]
MAFMMPVVKNDWDIYKSNRSRKTSECNTSSTPGRARKISETRSEYQGFNNNTSHQGPFPKHHSMPDKMSLRGFSRVRTCSENISGGRVKVVPQDRDVKEVSSSANNLKQHNEKMSWLEKIKKFVKQNKNEDERVQS